MTIVGIAGHSRADRERVAALAEELLEPEVDADGLPEHPVAAYSVRLGAHPEAIAQSLFHDVAANLRYRRQRAVEWLQAKDVELIEEYFRFVGAEVSLHESSLRAFSDRRKHEGHYGPDFLTPEYAARCVEDAGLRAFDETWVRGALRGAHRLLPTDVVFVTDVCRWREARVLRAKRGALWCVYSARDPDRASRAAAANDVGRLVVTVDGVRPDFAIEASGSAEDLREQVRRGLAHLFRFRCPETGAYLGAESAEVTAGDVGSGA